MTKKDYELIATGLYESLHYQTLGATEMQTKMITLTIKDIASRLAMALKRDNNRFDTERFLKACGLEAQL